MDVLSRMTDDDKQIIESVLENPAGATDDDREEVAWLLILRGGPLGKKAGFSLIESAAASGSTEAIGSLYYLAEIFHDATEADAAKRFAETAAERGDPRAQNILGIMYFRGFGVSRDYAKSFMWLKKSAEAGDEFGQLNLADSFENGDGIAPDQQEAVVWYVKAALQDNSNATQRLQILYKEKGSEVLSKVDAEELARLRAKYPKIFVVTNTAEPLPPSKKNQPKRLSPSTSKAELPKDVGAADQVTDGLKPGQIVFNPPPKMKVGVKQLVTVRIGDSEYGGDLKSNIGQGGPIREEKLPTGRFMSVSLSGIGFDFAGSPGQKNGGAQIVPKGGFSEWIFYVTPVESGKLKLLLTASVRYKILGKEEFQNQPVIARDIDVEVNRLYVIQAALLAEWKWIAGGIGSVLVASFGFLFKWWLEQRKKRATGNIES